MGVLGFAAVQASSRVRISINFIKGFVYFEWVWLGSRISPGPNAESIKKGNEWPYQE